MDEFEDLTWLRDLLRSWDDRHDGAMRVELRLFNKHTGEVPPPDDSWPQGNLGLLAFQLDEALKALAFVQYLKQLGREIAHP